MDAAPASLGGAADGLVGTVSSNGVVEPGTVAAEPGGEAPHVEHVPIKRKGSRKR
jgi:ribonuclease E